MQHSNAGAYMYEDMSATGPTIPRVLGYRFARYDTRIKLRIE
jgi:hypothetical protein